VTFTFHGKHGLYAAQFWNYLLQEYVTITEPSATKLNSVYNALTTLCNWETLKKKMAEWIDNEISEDEVPTHNAEDQHTHCRPE